MTWSGSLGRDLGGVELSPGNRFVNMMIEEWEREYSPTSLPNKGSVMKLCPQHNCLESECSENHVGEEPSAPFLPYRTSAKIIPILVASRPYVHESKQIGRGHIAQTCEPPGAFARWWNNLQPDMVWRCEECGGRWRLAEYAQSFSETSRERKWIHA